MATDDGASANVRRLTAAIARGDAAAFARFYETWFDRTYAIARSFSRRDESFCLDIVQDTMLRVIRNMKPLPNESALSGWLARAVASTVVDHLRRDQRRAAREEEAARRAAPEAVVDAEQLVWVRSQLAALPAADRALLSERFEHGRTLRETGAAAGISAFAAHGRIRRLLVRLRALAKELL